MKHFYSHRLQTYAFPFNSLFLELKLTTIKDELNIEIVRKNQQPIPSKDDKLVKNGIECSSAK